MGEDGAIQLLAVGSLAPYDGNGWVLAAFALLRDLHVTLLAGIPGEALLLATGIAGLFLSITGLVLWWPVRRGFRWRWLLPRPLAAALMIHARRAGAPGGEAPPRPGCATGRRRYRTAGPPTSACPATAPRNSACAFAWPGSGIPMAAPR